MATKADSNIVPRTGHWLPHDHRVIRKWLDGLIERSARQSHERLEPVLEDFKHAVNANGILKALCDKMFTEIPTTPPYCQDPTLQNCQVRDFEHLLELFDTIMKEAPQWYDTGKKENSGLIGFPFNAALDWAMGTNAGFVFFLQREVNDHFQAILTQWGKYLTTEDSADALNNVTGWFCPDALRQLTAIANDPAGTSYTFDQLFQCPDPASPTFGFKSWDQFFAREFQWDKRPVADATNNATIVHSCESMPKRPIKQNVQQWDTFYLKGQPYALQPMLNNEPEARHFTGGTVYQAFLSALSYHRWHSPVTGTITKIRNVPGTYYSENWYEGFANLDGPDPAAADRSQAYIAHTATRGVIFIEADNPAIGLMAIVYIGMAEVSSCDFTVWEGQWVNKGDQLGESL